MIPNRVRRLVEQWLPWYDPAAEARHDERTQYIHDRSIAIRQEVEVRLARPDRIREAYRLTAERLDGSR
jgi:hypothetical protein